MSNYVKSTNFTAKDSLPTGDANKVIRGSEFDTEFNALVVAVATKSDLSAPTFTGEATFADLTATGTVNFSSATVSDLGAVTTADINGGTIDGVTIGGSSAGAGTFSSLVATTADINGGTVDNAVVGGSTPAAGTFTSLVATTADINGGTVDNATIGGTTPAAGTFSSLTATTANIDGGSIDGTVIGGATPAAVSGTTGTFSGAVSGTTGTFSGAVTGSNLNIANWDTAYGWGDHSTQGYLTSVAFTDIDAGAVTLSTETFSDVDNQIPTNAAVIDYVAATIPLISEVNDLSTVVTWATVPDAFISASSVNQHVSVEKATQTKTYTNGESSTITLSSAITSGVPVVSVTKEIPQTGVTNNTWDVNSSTENYTRINSAPATTLNFNFFDVDGAAYSQNFSVSGQDINPDGIAFNTDGTKMFMVGRTNDSVFEYALSTGFDVSTASYTQSFSVASQEISPSGLAFNTDGTKMFVVGFDGDDVNEYTLSTGFDVSTASYSQNFSVASQETDPTDIAFNTDGTKMFIVGVSGDDVNEYALSTGFDVSTASYTQNFSVSAQETTPHGLAFNTDGTKMFIVGTVGDDVNQYTLSTGFDVSTASFSKLFSVSAEDTAPKSIRFNTDGSKMFILGDAGDDVNEYNITPVSVSLGTGSFASADVGKTIEANSGVFVLTATDGSFSQITAPTSYAQVASGSWEMYAVVYNTTDGDLELSQAITSSYDISSATFTQSKNLVAQSSDGTGLAFKPDGTKMFVCDRNDQVIYQYSLSTAFDISTASYDSVSYNVSAQATSPNSISFNSDGTKMFVLCLNTDQIHEYTLSTAYSLASVSYVDGFNVNTQETTPTGMHFKPDGTKVFIIGEAQDRVFEYALSTAFDISTATYTGSSNSVSSQETVPSGLTFNGDGTSFFVTGEFSDNVHEYSLTTPFSVVSAGTFVRTLITSSKDSDMGGLTFDTDGVRLFLIGRSSNSIHEYSTGAFTSPSGYHAAHTTTSTDSTFWTDINSMTADEAAGDGAIYYAVSTDDRTTWKIAKSTDGERSIVRNSSGTWQFNSNGTYGSETWTNGTTNTELATLQEAMTGATTTVGYDLASASYESKSFSVTSQETDPRAIEFNSDGTKMFVVGQASDTVFQYSLSTAYDISTASYDSVSFSVSSQESSAQGLVFKPDGTKMYIIGEIADAVFQYSLSTAFDLSTASYDSVSFSVSSQDTGPKAVNFNDDGTIMYVVGNNDSVFQYTLTTAYDISTASYASKSFSVTSQDTFPCGIKFNSDGTTMFILGGSNSSVFQYTLSTGFDVSTASYASIEFSTASQEATPRGITFNSDGTKLYIVGNNNDTVYQYTTAGTSYPNQMNKTQLDAVPDANHFTLSNDLDLAIIFNFSSGSTAPSSDGVSINYDANTLNQGAVLGTDYNWDFPATDKVRLTSLGDYNLKVRII